MARTALLVLVLLMVSAEAWAENCWMVGCRDDVGYIRIKPSSTGAPLPFVGRARPNVGDTAVLCEHAFLRVYPSARPIEKEARQEAAGNLLGPNTKVKVLEYVSRTADPLLGGDFAVVRVLSDDNKCPRECSKCGGIIY